MDIFLHGSRRSIEGLTVFDAIFDKLLDLSRGRLSMSLPLYDYLSERMSLPSSVRAVRPGEPVRADLAVSLGGDGTFLRTAQWVGASETPVLGVNAGHLGFLADMNPDEFLAEDAASLANLKVEPRRLLHVETSAGLPDDCWPYALNDVALLKTDSASMISVYASIDGRPLTCYQADGLIVATPTGSTGYNLSVGGPILEPSVDLVLISPVAPHLLAMRPLGVRGDSLLEFTVEARSDTFMLSLDGRSRPFPAGTTVRVGPAPFRILVAQRRVHHFASTLREKLLWGERPGKQHVEKNY